MIRILLSFSVVLLSVFAAAQGKVYIDAEAFPLFGKASDMTSSRYVRLPSSYEGISRPEVWKLGQCSSGMFVRFRTNSRNIYARWKSTQMTEFSHMTPCGVRGLDLYALEDGHWRFVRSGRPVGQVTDTAIVRNMAPEYREYMLYLSLYDGLSSLEIGVDDDAELLQPVVNRPSRNKPVVMYGTSILQGGCATRPGMAHTNIISRMLDREVINLGFSGNAYLDYEIAELMASVPDPGCFVLDYVPNASVSQIEQRADRFFEILRKAHPDVPVILVEAPQYAHMPFDTSICRSINERNAAQRAFYEKLKKAGVRKVYYVKTEDMIGDDGEATVDGVHLTDLGMKRYVDHILPVIRKALR